MTDDPPAPRKRPDQREHRFQAFVDRYIDRVVLPPMFTTGVDQAGENTQNQRARAAGRGIKFGIPDVYILQDGKSCWIELKIDRNNTTTRQLAVMAALRAAGAGALTAWSIYDVWGILRAAGFRLHGNAENICIELTARWQAADEAAKTKKPAAYRAPRVRATKAGLRVAAFSQRPR